MKKSFTKQDERDLAANIARLRVARIVQIAATAATMAAGWWISWHWFLIGSAFIWIIGKAAPPDKRLDDITGR